MPGPETTTQQTTDWQAKDAEINASRPAIGSTTLDLFEGNLGRHAERVDATPAPSTSAYEMGVDALAQATRSYVGPALTAIIDAQIDAYVKAMSETTPATMTEGVIHAGVLLTLKGAQFLVAPAVDQLITMTATVIKDPRSILTWMQSAMRSIAHPLETLDKVTGSTAHERAVAMRSLFIRGIQTGTMVAQQSLASYVEKQGGVDGAVYAQRIRQAAPMVSSMISGTVSFAVHRIYPMVDVDPTRLPKKDDAYALLYCVPTTVVSSAEEASGHYLTELAVQEGAALVPFVHASGKLSLWFGQDGRIHALKDLSQLTLSIGTDPASAIELSGIQATYDGASGLTITRAKMSRADKATLVLESLTISPYGWLSGRFTENDEARVFGSEYPSGIGVPKQVAREATSEASEQTTALAPKGGDSLTGHIATKFETLIPSGVFTSVVKAAMIGANYATSGRNLVGTSPSAPKPTTPEPKSATTTALEKLGLGGMTPAGLLEKIAKLDLVPAFMKEGRERVTFSVDELRVGEEPSLNIGVSTSIRPFENSPATAVEGLRLVWMVGRSPSVFLQGRDLLVSDVAKFHGIEASSDGLRVAAASLELPGIGNPEIFSLAKIGAFVEGLTVGKGVNARKAGATINDLTIARVLKVGRFGITMDNTATDNKRFTAELENGSLALPSFGMTFGGELSWGGGKPVEGKGSARLAGPASFFNDAISMQAASIENVTVKDREIGGTAKVDGLTVKLQKYTATASGSVSIDQRGLTEVTIASGQLVDANKRVVGTITGFSYKRDTELKFASARVLVPKTGPVRASAPEADKDSYLELSNIDLSSLVRALPAPAEQGPEPKALPATSEATTDAKPEAALAAPAKQPWAITAVNMSQLLIGPSGSNPILTVDFTNVPAPKPERPPGGLLASLRVDLGALKGKGDVDVHSDGDDLEKLVAEASKVEIGESFTIESLKHHADVLTIKRANVDIGALLGNLWPKELETVKVALFANLEANTKDRMIRSASIGGTVSGNLFGKALTLESATAELTATGGAVGTGTASAISGGTLGGKIVVNQLALSLFGAAIKLSGQLDVGTSVSGNVSGDGKVGGATIHVENLKFLGGKHASVDKVVTSIPRPAGGEVVQFLPPDSTTQVPSGNDIRITLNKVGFDVETGTVLYAQDEQVKGGTTAPTTESPATSERELEKTEVAKVENLGGIDVGNGAVVVRLQDLDARKVKGRDEVAVGGAATIKAGPLFGGLEGRVYIAQGAPAPDEQVVPGREKAPAPVGPSQVRVHIAKGFLGSKQQFTVNDVWIQRGMLWIKSAEVAVGDLLGAIPGVGDALAGVKAKITDLVITPDMSMSIGGVGVAPAGDLSLFEDKLSIQSPMLTMAVSAGPLPKNAEGTLLSKGWSLGLSSGRVVIRPVPQLSFTADKSTFALTDQGPSGSADAPTVGWSGFQASAQRFTINKAGFDVLGAQLAMDPSALKHLPGLGDVFGLLPDWLVAGDAPIVLGVKGIDVGYRVGETGKGGQIIWPDLGALRFGVRKASIKLGPVAAGFDLDKGEVGLGVSKHGDIKMGAQVPLGQGVGLEVGGMIVYGIDLDTKAKVATTEEDVLRFIGELTAKAQLSANLYIGIYGGVPSVFSAAGGLYAGLSMTAPMKARMSGAWPLPTGAANKGGGALDLFFEMRDEKGAYPLLKGVAGAYVSLHFLGTSKTLRKELASMNIAELHAHGGMSVRPGQSVEMLPSGDQFPYRKLHLDEGLRALLFDKDFQKEYQRSQDRLSGRFAKVWAAEDTLAQKTGAAPKEDPAQLETQRKAAEAEATEAAKAVKALDKKDHAGLSLLEQLRDKLGEYEWKLAKLKKLEAEGKDRSNLRAAADVVSHPTWGVHAMTQKGGKPAFKGRPVLGGTSAAQRLDLADFASNFGQASKEEPLDASDFEAKVACKREEIAEVERRRDNPERVAAEDRLSKATTDKTYLNRKEELADQKKEKVEAKLGRSRGKLLDSLYKASKVEGQQTDAQLSSAVEIEQLRIEKTQAEAALQKLGTATPAPTTDVVPATLPSVEEQLATFQREFWREHVKFLTEEITLAEERGRKRALATGSFDDKIGEKQRATLERAATARPDKKQEIEREIAEATRKRMDAIETSVGKLAKRLARIDELSAQLEGKGKKQDELVASKEKLERALQLQKEQLMRHVDNIARLTSLMEDKGKATLSDKLATVDETFDDVTIHTADQ